MRGRLARFAALGALVLASAVPAAAQRPELQARFTWQGVRACGHESPAFVVMGEPPGTVALRFTMHDMQAPRYPHGGGTVRYTGRPEIPAGAFRYNGPCPPPGTRHEYRWTVEALGSSGQVLAATTVSRPFPP